MLFSDKVRILYRPSGWTNLFCLARVGDWLGFDRRGERHFSPCCHGQALGRRLPLLGSRRVLFGIVLEGSGICRLGYFVLFRAFELLLVILIIIEAIFLCTTYVILFVDVLGMSIGGGGWLLF